MELQRHHTRPASRCPYCHDRVGDGTLSESACLACGARHHAECLRELRRCAVAGCERPAGPSAAEEAELRDGPGVRAVRRALRRRVQAFVAANARPIDLERQLAQALRRRRRARSRGDRAEVEDATIEVVAVGRRLDPETASRVHRREDASGRLDAQPCPVCLEVGCACPDSTGRAAGAPAQSPPGGERTPAETGRARRRAAEASARPGSSRVAGRGVAVTSALLVLQAALVVGAAGAGAGWVTAWAGAWLLVLGGALGAQLCRGPVRDRSRPPPGSRGTGRSR